jgi:hypothetical protein
VAGEHIPILQIGESCDERRVWPHFSPGSQFYDMLLSKGWLVHTPDGKPDRGGLEEIIGPDIDTTNPEQRTGSGRRFATGM